MRSKLGWTVAAVVLAGTVAGGCSGDDDGGGGGAESEAAGGSFCDGAQEVSDLIASAAGIDDVTQVVEQMESLDVPAEISEDWQAISEVFGAVIQAGDQPADQVPSLDVDQARAVEASEAINTYVQEECDFSFGGGTAVGSSGSADY